MKKSKKKKGVYLKQKRVKAVSYVIIIISIVLIVVVSLLKLWGALSPGLSWKLMITLLVIGIGSGIFTLVNGAFRLGK